MIDLISKYNDSLNKIVNSEEKDMMKVFVVEECSELIKAITKMERSKGYSDYVKLRSNIIEEMSDVIISILLYIKENKIDEKELYEEIEIKMKRKVKEITIE